jgi:ATP-dependent DNA helicase RecQ
MESFLASKKYCMLGTCRRQNLLMYFGEKAGPSCGDFHIINFFNAYEFFYPTTTFFLILLLLGRCDNCCNVDTVEKDVSHDAITMLNCIKELGGHFGLNLPIDVLRGSNVSFFTTKNSEKIF